MAIRKVSLSTFKKLHIFITTLYAGALSLLFVVWTRNSFRFTFTYRGMSEWITSGSLDWNISLDLSYVLIYVQPSQQSSWYVRVWPLHWIIIVFCRPVKTVFTRYYIKFRSEFSDNFLYFSIINNIAKIFQYSWV